MTSNHAFLVPSDSTRQGAAKRLAGWSAEMDLDSVERGQATARFTPATSISWLERIQAEGWRRIAEVNRELWLLLSLFGSRCTTQFTT